MEVGLEQAEEKIPPPQLVLSGKTVQCVYTEEVAISYAHRKEGENCSEIHFVHAFVYDDVQTRDYD